MSHLGRRGFLGTSLIGGTAAFAAPAETDAVREAPPPVTQLLARYAVHGQFADLPAAIRKEAARTLLDRKSTRLNSSH